MPGPFISVGHAKIGSVLFATTPEIFSRNSGMRFYFHMLSPSPFTSLTPRTLFHMKLWGGGPSNFIQARLNSLLL